MMIATLKRFKSPAIPLLWAFLLFITVAEFITAAVQPQLGLVLHALALAGLVFYAGASQDLDQRRFALALTLAPLIRLLSLSLPLPEFRQLYWYPLVSTPLLLTIYIIARYTGTGLSSFGLRPGNLAVQLMLMCGGFGLGALEYTILQPAPLIRPFAWPEVLAASVILIIFTGFTEELIFRGLMQSVAAPVLGRWGITYIALLFAVLHIGYLSLADVFFVFAVGLVFGLVVRASGSLLGVTLAHGLTNVFLFLVMPYAAQDASGAFAATTVWLAWGGSALSLSAMAFMAWRWRFSTTRSPSVALAPALLPVEQETSFPSFAALYQQLSGDTLPPLAQLQIAIDAPVKLRARLFIRSPFATQGAGGLYLHADNKLSTKPIHGLLSDNFPFVVGAIAINGVATEDELAALYQTATFYRIRNALSRQLSSELFTLAQRDAASFKDLWKHHLRPEQGSHAYKARPNALRPIEPILFA